MLYHYTDTMSSNAHGCKLFWNTDVRFGVRSADGNGDDAESSSVTFHAHRFVLYKYAPKLAALFDSRDEKIATASITNVEPAIFRLDVSVG